uniref:Ig-like domain-containing protein n=2 Tax=Parascaris univalens TaxID=6257 RepID=A0A915BA24_PARUN
MNIQVQVTTNVLLKACALNWKVAEVGILDGLMQQRTCSTTSRFLWTFILLCYAIFDSSRSAVTTRRHISRRTMRWKQNSENPHHSLQYVASFGDHKEATITRHSNFLQTFKLGYKIILVCEAEGYPEPSITWYKNGAEMNTHNTAYLVQTQTYGNKVRTRLEIDPATMGDQGVYSCLTSNRYGCVREN